MKRNVWHPQKSIANDGSEEGGRGSFHSSEPQVTDSQLKTAKKRAKIPRRRTPTVDVSALVSRTSSKKQRSTAASGKTKARDTYDTIENQEGPSILESSSVVYRRESQITNSTNADIVNDLCGWRDRELECYKAAGDRSTTSSNFDRSRLQTPAEGLRSNLQSRAGNCTNSRHTSSYGKRKECYIFQHFEELYQYIEHYRITHSYTTLTVPGLKRKMCCGCENGLTEGEELPPEPKVVEQDPESFMQPGVKSYYQDDPYLCELVSRLGVRGLVQREQQLLRSRKPTTPSIAKRTKPREDLVVCSSGKTSEEDCNNDPQTTGNGSYQNSPKMSRPATGSVGQSAALELPKIAQSGHIPVVIPPHAQRNKQQNSNSVISVNKYLQVVTSQQQQNLQEGHEDSEEKRDETSSQDCLPRVQSSGMSYLDDTPSDINVACAAHESGEQQKDKTIQGRHLNGCRDAVEFNTPNSATMKQAVQEQLMMLDSLQKEKLISNKAHALGLTSRDWAKTAKAKRMLGNGTTKQHVNGNMESHSNEKEKTDYRHAFKSRPATRMTTAAATNQTRASSRMEQSTNHHHVHGYTEQAARIAEKLEQKKRLSGDYVHNQKPRGNRRGREVDDKKLEKLRSIYDSSSRKSKATPSQQSSTRQHSRCGNRRMMSRPVTRLSSWEQTTKRTNQPKISQSRPVTQVGQRRSKGGEEGQLQPSPGRASVKEMMDLERHLDESCCWNEIPTKTKSHSKTDQSGQRLQSSKPETGNGTETLDFDVNDIMLRAKHKNHGGVAMVTVRLRKQRNPQHNRQFRAQYHHMHPSS